MRWILLSIPIVLTITSCSSAPTCEDAHWLDGKDVTGHPYVHSRRCVFELCRSDRPTPNPSCQ